MIDPTIKSLLLDEVRYWPGAALLFEHGGKHAAVSVLLNEEPSGLVTASCSASDHRAAANVVGDLRKVLRGVGATRVGKDEALAIRNDRHAEYLRRTKPSGGDNKARRKTSRDNIAQLMREIQADRRRPLVLPHRERKVSKQGVRMQNKPEDLAANVVAYDGVPPGCKLPFKEIDRRRVYWRLVDDQGRCLGERQTYDELISEPEWPENVAGVEFVPAAD